jgi:GMP synthase (glutamine-hydrolysing)
MTDIHSRKILILDFGSQYTQLIARRVREVGVYSEIYAFDVSAEDIQAFKPHGIILSGGPESVAAEDSPRVPELVFQLGVPVLGICYGMQAMARQFGGKVACSEVQEFGYAQIGLTGNEGLLHDIHDHLDASGRMLLDVWMSHGDKVVELPAEFELMAETESCPIAGMYHRELPLFGIQFHPEAPILSKTHCTPCAKQLAMTRCCWACPEGLIPPWWRPSCTAPLAINSPVYSWTTDCCAKGRANR